MCPRASQLSLRQPSDLFALGLGPSLRSKIPKLFYDSWPVPHIRRFPRSPAGPQVPKVAECKNYQTQTLRNVSEMLLSEAASWFHCLTPRSFGQDGFDLEADTNLCSCACLRGDIPWGPISRYDRTYVALMYLYVPSTYFVTPPRLPVSPAGTVSRLSSWGVGEQGTEIIKTDLRLNVFGVKINSFIYHTYYPSMSSLTWTLDYSRKSTLGECSYVQIQTLQCSFVSHRTIVVQSHSPHPPSPVPDPSLPRLKNLSTRAVVDAISVCKGVVLRV